MSVTFSVDNTDHDWFNLGNRSAGILLFDLLGYSREDRDLWGELDPSDVLRRLATAESKVSALVTPETESRGTYMDENGVGPGCLVIESGYDSRRLQRFITGMRDLATSAVEKGQAINYG